MTFIRQDKIGNIFFSWTAYMFPPENEYKSLLPRNAHGTYNTACTNDWITIESVPNTKQEKNTI